MTIHEPPALRIAGERFRLHAQRGHDLPKTFSEYALDCLLTQLATLANPGREKLTKAALADVVERAGELARQRTENAATCECGHTWGDHFTGRGCLECDPCTATRPPTSPGADSRQGGN